MATPHRCPVCFGNGKVNEGFYNQTGGAWSGSSTRHETCRSCNGTGVVWETPPMTIPLTVPVVTWPPNTTIGTGVGVVVCTCPQEVKDGKNYIGDNFCPLHSITVTCRG